MGSSQTIKIEIMGFNKTGTREEENFNNIILVNNKVLIRVENLKNKIKISHKSLKEITIEVLTILATKKMKSEDFKNTIKTLNKKTTFKQRIIVNCF